MNKLKLIVNHQKSCFWYRGVKTLHIPLALEKMRGGNVGGGFAGNKFLAGRFFNYSTWAAFKGREACVRWTSHSLFERAPWQASQRGAEKFFQSPTGGLARAKTQVKYFSSFYSKVGGEIRSGGRESLFSLDGINYNLNNLVDLKNLSLKINIMDDNNQGVFDKIISNEVFKKRYESLKLKSMINIHGLIDNNTESMIHFINIIADYLNSLDDNLTYKMLPYIKV